MNVEIDVQGILLERLYDAVAELSGILRSMPAPQVNVPPTDLGAIVTAVNGLRPSASADEIARAIQKVIAPPTDDDGMVPVVQELVSKLEELDFRLKGSMPAFGASGPSNISDNPSRQLGHVTVDNFPVGQEVSTSEHQYENRFDYDTRLDGNPVYIGFAEPGTATGTASWRVYKFTYDVSARATRKQIQDPIAWDSRTVGW